jgi:hypothetical protein
MKVELQVTSDGSISLHQNSGEHVELTVLLPGEEYRMTIASMIHTYVGQVAPSLRVGVTPRGTTPLER